jgi:hypothetical protein
MLFEEVEPRDQFFVQDAHLRASLIELSARLVVHRAHLAPQTFAQLTHLAAQL